MNELISSLLATLDSLASNTVPILVGFISAWFLFEVTERRRAQRSQRELRLALVAELENAEVVASTIVSKYARFSQSKEEVAIVAREIRWFKKVGRQRMEAVGLMADLPAVPSEFESLSDAQLVALYSSIKETIGTKIIVPVLDRALAGQTSGFRAIQIQALSMVRWQIYLLEQDAEFMHELFRLTFTVTDEDNHKTVVENHDQRSVAYARRAQTLLRAMRTALELVR